MADTLVDGISLRTEAYNVTTYGGLMTVPEKRGSNIVLAGVHGEVHVPNKVYAANSIVLGMWIVGCEEDGSMPTSRSQREEVLAHARMLTRMFGKPGLITVTQDIEGGQVEAKGEVVQAYDFTTMAGVTRAEFAVEIQLPDPFWQDTADTVQAQVLSGADPQVVTFTDFAGATAPLVGAKFELQGPVLNPVMRNPVTGQWVRLKDIGFGSGTTWVLDRYTSKTADGTNRLGITLHGGGRTWLDLTATGQGYQVTVEGADAGAVLTLTGRRKYLVPA